MQFPIELPLTKHAGSVQPAPSLASPLPHASAPTSLLVAPSIVVRILAAGIVLLGAAHLLTIISVHVLGVPSLYGLVDRFDMNREANIPAWFTASLLLACASVLALIGIGTRSRHDPFARHWYGLALLFLAMSADEGGQLHELLMRPSQAMVDSAGGWLHFAWVVPGALLAAVVGLVYVHFLASLPSRLRRLLILAGALYLGGAIGMEIVGGWVLTNQGETATYALIVGVEELAEMTGIAVAICALLQFLAKTTPAILLNFGSEGFMREAATMQCSAGPTPADQSPSNGD